MLGGLVAYPREAAADVMRAHRKFMETAPLDLTVYVGLVCTPDGMPVTALVVCWSGADLAEGEKAIAPLRRLVGEPLMDAMQPMPFPAMQSILDDAFPSGTRNYWKAEFAKGLSDELVDVLVERGKTMTSPMSSLLIEYYGGVGEQNAGENAFAQRGSNYLIGFMPQWTDPAEDAAQIAWAKESWDAIQPHVTGGYLLNYLSEDEGPDVIKAAFGANYQRLAELKGIYDPTNFFSINQNIRPAA